MTQNEIHFTGVIAYRTKLRSTETGNVINFTLRNEIQYRDKVIKGGLNCVAWSEMADIVDEYRKGDVIEIEGFATNAKAYGAKDASGHDVYTTQCVIAKVCTPGGAVKQIEPGHVMRRNIAGSITPFDIE